MRNKNGKTVFYENNGKTVSYRLNVLLDKTFRRKKSVVPFLLSIILLNSTYIFAQEQASDPMTWKEAWRGLDEAIRLYDAEEFAQAGELFRKLRLDAPEGEFDVDVLRLLEGTSFWKAEMPEKARESLENYEELKQIEYRIQRQRVKGDSNLQLAEKKFEDVTDKDDPTGLKESKDLANVSKKAFESALRINPGDDYSLTKLEKTLSLLKKIEEQEKEQESENQENSEKQQDQEQQNSQDQENQDQENQDSQDQQNQDQEDQQQESEDPQNDQEEEQDSQDEQDQSQGSEGEQEQESEPSEGTEPTEQPLPEDYSKEQAQTILDTYDEQERRQRRQFLQQRVRTIPVEKDW